MVEPPEREKKKISADENKRERLESEALLYFKEANLDTNLNQHFDCRKRKGSMSAERDCEPTQNGAKPKKSKSETVPANVANVSRLTTPQVITKHGVWRTKNVPWQRLREAKNLPGITPLQPSRKIG